MSRRQADLRSFLAGPIKAFVQFKRALGRKYRNEAAALRLLDAYVAEHSIAALEQIDCGVIDAFLASRRVTEELLREANRRFRAFAPGRGQP